MTRFIRKLGLREQQGALRQPDLPLARDKEMRQIKTPKIASVVLHS